MEDIGADTAAGYIAFSAGVVGAFYFAGLEADFGDGVDTDKSGLACAGAFSCVDLAASFGGGIIYTIYIYIYIF